VQADVTTDRRLHGTGGQARSLYAELMRNLSTRSRPEGGAMQNLVERWVGDVHYSIQNHGGTENDVKHHLARELRSLQELVSGFDFATVITRYYEAYLSQSEELQDAALRWLRGEYKTKTEAREALGVRTVIDDTAFYDYLKLLAAFVRIAGYAGLLVNVDELVVLSHRLANTASRNRNYEAILRIFNDCVQGNARGLMFVFAATDECMEDQRRGIYSYEALRRRLQPPVVAQERRDLAAPVISLANLTPEDCYVLLCNIRHVHAAGDPDKYLVDDQQIEEYLRYCNGRMGAAFFQTPGDTVRGFVTRLNLLGQDNTLKWSSLLNSPGPEGVSDRGEVQRPGSQVDDLTEFRL
jgi:hypothetical protein